MAKRRGRYFEQAGTDTAFHSGRRRVLQGMVAAGVLPLTHRMAWAQSGAAFLRLPRHALIIGNSKYQEAPLRNPANDAKAMAEELKRTGFEVALHVDAGREQMLQAITAHEAYLAKRNAIGLFYFAGHGAQLAWRNYLIPVDAVIDKLEDVQSRAVELNTLLQGLTRAKNPMNVIVLDACRDNPFGTRVPTEQKGLSQFDAPLSSLLAYATSPGNVASDGEGANGLYTESLVRELKVPEAKIEDVFKRVRLNVRRRSQGQQIPWESTSLEEDFYFLPPKELKKLAEAEAAREFEAELAIWEKIKAANDPAPLEDYLRRYPSGRFSELAQLRLDQVLARQGEKKITIESSAQNPFSKGTAVADTNRKVGDSYTYRVLDLYTKLEREKFSQTITQITDTEVVYDNGVITDLLGNEFRLRDGLHSTGAQIWGVEYAIGKHWTTRIKVQRPGGPMLQTELEVRVVAREKISVPAGVFDAFVVESSGWATGPGVNIQLYSKRWIAPDRVRSAIAIEYLRKRGQRVVLSEREELVSYKQS